MEANTRNLERIFDQTIAYQIPLFQRPYVWNEEKNWQPLWDDIQSLLDKQLVNGKTHSHFLGAVVLEQVNNPTGSIEARQVIDGQQRLTTLQLFLIAVRDYCASINANKYTERFTDLTSNKQSRIDQDEDRYKVWPTNCDRDDFVKTHSSASIDSVLTSYLAQNKSSTGKSIPDAYLFFYKTILQWFSGAFDDEVDNHSFNQDDRLEALWQVVRAHLQVVVIDLEREDEAQVIFETLNARGTQLLPADLVKNYLFHRAQSAGEDIEKLYSNNWRAFEKEFWREEVNQGRIKRPRIDLFLQHYLSLKTLDDVRVSHLFNTFKHYAQTADNHEQSISSAEQLKSLSAYGYVYETLDSPPENTKLAKFMTMLKAVDTATVYPFLLEVFSTLQSEYQDELNRILDILESFLIRRMICGLTAKNYNKIFIDLVKASIKHGKVDESAVKAYLLKGDGDSNRFPDDEEFHNAWLNNPSYKRLAQYKIRAVLSALDMASETSKSEHIGLPSGLTIEHVMPVSWEENWPLPQNDSLEALLAETGRENIINTFGNLTLITGSLNPSLSNGAWPNKKPELIKYSKLNLNRYFHDVSEWNDEAIKQRGENLYELAIRIWPYPEK